MEKAYEVAKNNGYEGRLYAPKCGAELLDPNFWIAIGKAKKWDKKCTMCGEYEGGHQYKHIFVAGGDKRWIHYWHQFIDHLAEGKEIDLFFNELLK